MLRVHRWAKKKKRSPTRGEVCAPAPRSLSPCVMRKDHRAYQVLSGRDESRSLGELLSTCFVEVVDRMLDINSLKNQLSLVTGNVPTTMRWHYAQALFNVTSTCNLHSNLQDVSHAAEMNLTYKRGQREGCDGGVGVWETDTEREIGAGAGKFSKVELGNRCEWGGGGGARPWRERCKVACSVYVCVKERGCMRVNTCTRGRTRTGDVCAARAGKGHERTSRARLFYSAWSFHASPRSPFST